MEYQPLAPKKKVSKGIVIGVVIAVIIVVLLLVAFIVMPVLNASRYPLFKGAYAVWDYSTTGSSTTLSGAMRLDITDMTSTTFTMKISFTGDVPMPTETETYPIAESITVFWTLGTYQGMENVNTIYGVKSLKHYVDYNGSMTSDYYVGKDNNWPYKIVESESGFTIPFEISDTNIDWVKNG